jgi:hypothetical protein
MANIPYEARLVMLGMESLETRRLKLCMQFAYKILFGIVQQCLASTLHREPEATITNCMSREAGWSPENTSSVTELLNPGIIFTSPARALQILPYFSFFKCCWSD